VHPNGARYSAARFVGSPNRATVAGGHDDYHPAVRRFNAATALAELIIAHLVSSCTSATRASGEADPHVRSRSRSRDDDESAAVLAAINLPAQLPYTDAVEPFVVGRAG